MNLIALMNVLLLTKETGDSMTIAEKFSELFNNNGTRFVSVDGESFDEVLLRFKATKQYSRVINPGQHDDTVEGEFRLTPTNRYS